MAATVAMVAVAATVATIAMVAVVAMLALVVLVALVVLILVLFAPKVLGRVRSAALQIDTRAGLPGRRRSGPPGQRPDSRPTSCSRPAPRPGPAMKAPAGRIRRRAPVRPDRRRSYPGIADISPAPGCPNPRATSGAAQGPPG